MPDLSSRCTAALPVWEELPSSCKSQGALCLSARLASFRVRLDRRTARQKLKDVSCATVCARIAGQAVPLEYNMDGLHAINFAKGCYVGQELIARAHYQGAVRKRLMPASIEALDRASHSLVAHACLTRPVCEGPCGGGWVQASLACLRWNRQL